MALPPLRDGNELMIMLPVLLRITAEALELAGRAGLAAADTALRAADAFAVSAREAERGSRQVGGDR